MTAIHLSKRLNIVASYIKEGARIADIGSDHAYLPSALVQQGKIEFAVAGEVVKGPFERAEKEVQFRGLKDFIEVRFGDGLEVISLEDKIDTVTICGMGGVLIRNILNRGFDQGNLTGKETFILQPNVGEYSLRAFLKKKQYQIIAEDILEENDKIYEVIVAEPSVKEVEYSELQLKYGPKLLKDQNSVFKKKWTQEKQKLEFVKKQIEQSSRDQTRKLKEITEQVKEIEELLL